MEDNKIPWLSCDIGACELMVPYLIEFQMEFAYDGFKDKKQVKNLLKKSIEHFL